MGLEKLTRLVALASEARAIVNDLLWNRPARRGVLEVYLLGLLAQIQSIAVSLRTAAITGRTARADPAGSAAAGETQLQEKLAFFRSALAAPAPRAPNVLPFERRRRPADRRVLHTYLARDRRSGIADRRRRRPPGSRAG
jgi:hypothetical protein